MSWPQNYFRNMVTMAISLKKSGTIFQKWLEPPIKVKEKDSVFAPYKAYIEADLQSIIAIILDHVDSQSKTGDKKESLELPEVDHHLTHTNKFETHSTKKGNFFRSVNASPNRTTQNQSLPFLLLSVPISSSWFSLSKHTSHRNTTPQIRRKSGSPSSLEEAHAMTRAQWR